MAVGFLALEAVTEAKEVSPRLTEETYVTGRYIACAARYSLKEILQQRDARSPNRPAHLLPSCHLTQPGRPLEIVDSSQLYPRIHYTDERGRKFTVWTVPENLIVRRSL